MYLLYVELQYKDKKKVMNDQILNEELQDELDQKTMVQDVVDKVYPHIITTLGPSEYVKETPKVEIWNDIYARYSGIPEMRGEDSDTSKAEWKAEDNTIYVYYLNMKDIEDIIRSLLHEYTHSLQDPDPTKRKEQRKLGYDGDSHEMGAHAAEEDWEDYLIYLQDNPPVNVGDNVKIIETKLETKSDLLNETLLVIGFEDDGTPVTVNETDTLLESINVHPTTINLIESEVKWAKIKDIKQKITEVTSKDGLTKKFLTSIWPKYRSQLYSKLYNTYHPSTYVESFNRPSGNFEDALETVADAVHDGKKLGLIDSSVEWSDIYHYEGDGGYSNPDPEKKFIDDDGVPTLNDQLEIMDNTNLDWIHGILLFDVLEDIVDEFKSYCGENGVDESGMGKCMDDFPPGADLLRKGYIDRTPSKEGTLKQDYYTLFNFMRELEKAGIPVAEYMKSPIFPNIIKLVDDNTTDYDTTGEYSPMRQDPEAMDVPERIDEQWGEDGIQDPRFNQVLKTIFRMMANQDLKKKRYQKIVDKLDTSVFNFDEFWHVLVQYFSYPRDEDAKQTARRVWLILNYNNEKYDGVPETLEYPESLFTYNIRYKEDYSSYQREEECDSSGYGEESGEECYCSSADKYVTDKDGFEKRVDCTDDYNDGEREDCECTQFDYKDVEVYFYPLMEIGVISFEDIKVDYGMDYHDFLHEAGDLYEILYQNSDEYELEEDAETWDYFSDNEQNEIYEFDVEDEGDVSWYIDNFLKKLLGTKPQTEGSDIVTEQDEQLNLFPTGEWEFPAHWEEVEDNTYGDVKTNVPEPAFKKVMQVWDKNGIDFSVFKLLGIPNDSVTQTFVLKRYIQNTKNPLPVSYTFNCDDLTELFDTTNRDYDMDYIKEYICGDDSFWDQEDWYNYEWENYMTDQIDEGNWKTISEIFGGVSQSVAEDMLQENSSSEEVDELIEKHQEDIDEIQRFIVWAHNDEHEYTVKGAMAQDIKDKILDHFNGVGRLVNDDNGRFSYVIEGDLRDYVNDIWDNTEDVFHFHPDYRSETLEGLMVDSTGPYMKELLFAALMEEEYRFWDYCEGKRGECLEPETKWFDGYWYPDININNTLTDRLTELTYEPTITTPEGETKPLQEQYLNQDGKIKKDGTEDAVNLDETPFTKLDVNIMNRIVNTLTREQITAIWEEDEVNLESATARKWVSLVRLYGMDIEDQPHEWAKATRFAKWVDDNWDEAERIKQIELDVTPDTTISDDNIDFGLVTQPVKEWPTVYNIQAVESYWAKEYRYGEAEFTGYGLEDAKQKAISSWYEYDIDMEYGDQGDTDDHDINVESATFVKSLKETRNLGPLLGKLYRSTTYPLNEHNTPKKGLNPEVQEGDVIKLIYLDDVWANITPGTLGVVMGFPDKYKIMVSWIVGPAKMTKLALLRDVDTYMLNNRDLDSEVKEIPELIEQYTGDAEYDEAPDEDIVTNEPFTKLELSILKMLHRNLTRTELTQVVDSTPNSYNSEKYFKVLKLFGITPDLGNDHFENNSRASVYAKLATDNWMEKGNFEEIKSPKRVPLKWYNVGVDETGSQVEYKTGDVEVLAYDANNAEEKGNDEFWDWGGNMETVDYGDYESYDRDINSVSYQRMDEWLDEKPMTLNESTIQRLREKEKEDRESGDNVVGGGYEIYEPLTPSEVKILNYITKIFTKEELEGIWEKPDSVYENDKWVKHIKLFGVSTHSDEAYASSTRFAKWATDNWSEGCNVPADVPCDYSKVGTATKAYPSVYEIEATNSFWQRQFESGIIDISAYNEDDAYGIASQDWWDFDPDMEVNNYGDTDDHDLTIDQVNYSKTLQEDSDVFGQGLLEPSDPEEFEGDEEEWEKLVGDVEDDVEKDVPDSEYVYTGGKTDATKGYVAPSAEVTDNICKVKGFCSAQGPITFGQLRELVEEATSKRIQGDIGRGLFKTMWRIVPFFIPQILLAAVGVTVTRAINKIITPALKDTRGYKEWWGKAVLKAMDIAEGDYIPDITIGDDPISKVFFISDGLLQMIRDKYKLKFARYVADVAANEPDSSPVPEWFVENLLRNYLNQKFLLDPPLPIKKGTEERDLKEANNPFGFLEGDWKDELLNHEKNLSRNELKYKKLADNFDRMNVTIPVDIDDGEEPVIGTTDITFTVVRPYIFQGLRPNFLSTYDDDYVARGSEPTVIKYDLVFRSVEPGSLLEELLEDNSIEGREGLDARERLIELLMQEGYSINESLMKEYFKLYGITVGRMGNMYDSKQLQEQDDDTNGFDLLSLRNSGRDNWQDDNKFSTKKHNDSKLSVSPEVLIKYLNTHHRKKLIKELIPDLKCIIYNCYEGWRDDPDNEWDEEGGRWETMEDQAQGYCNECGDELNDTLEKLDQDLVKVGLVMPDEFGKTYIKKPFPSSYNLWIDGVVKEINPRFYVDSEENVSYIEDHLVNQLTEHKESKLNPQLMVGDEILVVSTEGIHDFGAPELYKPYVVVGIKHGTTMMKGGKELEDYPYYQVEPIGMTDEERTGAMLAGGGRMKPMYIFHRQDQWILRKGFRRGELNEHKESGLNPELEVDDIIRIIDIDREVENNAIKYHIPPPELKPEKFIPYAVVDKESNGSESKYPFRYTLVPEDKLEEYQKNLDRGYGEYKGYEKLLFPWVHQWISADIPMANKVDRLTISEHKQPELTPDLEEGDIIRVIEVDGEHANMPKVWGIYKVYSVRQDNATQRFYYELSGNTSEVVPDTTFSTTRLTNAKYLYPGDVWIYADKPTASKVDRKTISENWRDTSWEDDDGKITIGDVSDYIGNDIRNISVSDLENKLGENVSSVTQGEERIMKADLQYPIILVQKDGEFSYVLDGNHRLAKAIMTGEEYIKAKVLYLDDKNTPEEFKRLLGGEEVINETISEHKEELNQPLSLGDVIRVVDVDKDSTYEEPKYSYDTGNKLGNSLMTNRHRGEIWGSDTIPQSMKLYGVFSKTLYKPTDRDNLNPYWILWPVDENYKPKESQDFYQIILTDKDMWMTLKKHHSNIPGDIEKKQKEYDDSGRNITSRRLNEDDDSLNDLVFRDEPQDKHKRRMARDLGSLNGFPINNFKNLYPPNNESDTTEEEIDYLDTIPVDNDFIKSADDIDKHFKTFLNSKKLDYPTEKLKTVIDGVRAIILILKYHYNRPRPWQIAKAKGLKLDSETLQSASTPSYPSGHAVQGKFIGRYLADLYPEYGDELEQIGEDIAYSRNVAKVHYPSDTAFGKLLGDEMYDYVYQPQEELELSESIIDIVDDSHPYNETQYKGFVDFVVNELGISQPPPIRVEVEPTSKYTTGYYNNKKEIVKVRGYQRQLADILRSIAHELVHHKQKEDGLINKPHPEIGGPIEDEANSMSGRLVKTYGKKFPEIYSLLQEQYDKPEDIKKIQLTTQLFDSLDNSFGIYPHPEGELEYDGANMQLYSYDDEAFVPIEFLYRSIPNMIDGGLPKEDGDLLINILTDWVNSRMTFKDPQLNEQTDQNPTNIEKSREDKTPAIRERLMLETDEFKVVVPLNGHSFCRLAGDGKVGYYSECVDGKLEENDAAGDSKFMQNGTTYFIVSKRSGKSVLLFDRGKVPFLIDKNPTYTLYEKETKDTGYEYKSKTDMLRFMSDKPELIEFFKIGYTTLESIKFNMVQSEDAINKLVEQGGAFGQEIYKIMNGNYHEDDIYNMLVEFSGGVDIFTDDYIGKLHSEDKGAVFIRGDVRRTTGVVLQIEEDTYHYNVLNLNEDDVYYYQMGRNSYYDTPYEDIEDTELDYIGGHFTKDTLDKWNEIMTILGEDRLVKQRGEDLEEGDINDPMNRYFDDEWDSTSRDLLDELGYGIGDNRQKEMNSYLDSEIVFDGQYSGNAIEIELTWEQLLFIVGLTSSKTFQELIESPWNEIDSTLSDIWWDGYGYDDSVGEELNTIMNKFLTRILENPDRIKTASDNYNKLISILNQLQFDKVDIGSISSNSTYWVDKDRKKQVSIENFDSKENMLAIKVIQDVEGKNIYRQYRIKPEELSDYILSDDLFIKEPEKNRENYGTWGVKYL